MTCILVPSSVRKYNIGINQTTENLSQLYLCDWDIAKVVPSLLIEEERKMFLIREFRFINYLVFLILRCHFLVTLTSFNIHNNPVSGWCLLSCELIVE